MYVTKMSGIQENARGWDLPEATRQKLEKAWAEARRVGLIPECSQGHGTLDLAVSRKGAVYWKCLCPECEETQWFRHFSDVKCPECGSLMELVPSKKVKGGNFLKCSAAAENETKHKDDVVLFRNRTTGHWEKPTPGWVAPPPEPALKRVETPPPKTIAAGLSLPAKKVLSAVARLNGLGSSALHPQDTVIELLRGERSAQVLAQELDKLPTFGQLKDHSSREIEDLIDLLIDADCLRFIVSARAVVLTPQGVSFMKL